MKTVFLIINYNDSATTTKLIKQICNYKSIDLIVVVDNNSSDSSYEELIKYENSKIYIIKNSKNGGYGDGINFGCNYIETLVNDCNLIISNSDIEIDSNTVIEKLVSSMSTKVGIIAPMVREHQGYNRGWKLVTPFQDGLMNLIVIHRVFRKLFLYYNNSHYNESTSEVDVVSGSFFLMKLSVLRDIGYFDNKLFLYYEENVLAYKLHKDNLKSYINNECEVFHNHSITIDKNIDKMKKYRILKQSQLYYHITYNKIGLGMKLFLKGTAGLSAFFLRIIYSIQNKM